MDLYCDYDENLSQNAFFRKLQSDHKIIIETAPLENWIICIPRAATIQTPHLSSSDFLLAHVLIPNEELPQSHFTSLSGIDVRLEQKRLIAIAQRTEIGEDTPTESSVNAPNRIESSRWSSSRRCFMRNICSSTKFGASRRRFYLTQLQLVLVLANCSALRLPAST